MSPRWAAGVNGCEHVLRGKKNVFGEIAFPIGSQVDRRPFCFSPEMDVAGLGQVGFL